MRVYMMRFMKMKMMRNKLNDGTTYNSGSFFYIGGHSFFIYLIIIKKLKIKVYEVN
jgi:hypothetical protein